MPIKSLIKLVDMVTVNIKNILFCFSNVSQLFNVVRHLVVSFFSFIDVHECVEEISELLLYLI